MRLKQTIEKIYQKKSQLEHVLLRPEMYIGPISTITESMWILSDCQTKFINKKIQYCPGLYKLFDEVLVNAADNFQRDNKMKKIQVTIDNKKGISILNDGESVPAVVHKQHKMYVAELIFGHLLTGSNYQDNDKKVTGGRNGFGAKLANIFSTKFQVQTGDSQNKKLLKIRWTQNMSKMQGPEVQTISNIESYTKVSFIPDFKRFGLKQFSEDMIQLMKKRVYDLAGTMKIKVYLNGNLLKIKSFQQYVNYYTEQPENKIIIQLSKRWKIILECSQTQFQQVSFVNSICTYKGGTHINYIMDQIIERLTQAVLKKAKNIQVKPAQIRSFFFLFVCCLIENPIFDSQTKQNLVSKPSTYGSQFTISQKSIKQILNTGIVDRIIASIRSKEGQKISKQLKKKKGQRLVIPKLDDANLAGTKSHCTLILTEGDSAKALAICGLAVVGRDNFGVFPLRGKPLNVNELSIKQVSDNQQLKNVIQILGLQFNKHYESTKDLRYQSVMIMADQDNDGSHIKGLLLNFFATFWPSLCQQEGFLKEFITPIIKCKKNEQSLSFFSQTQYQKWKSRNNISGWKIKYYKGLGTSTAVQGKEYFSNINKHEITFDFQDQCFKNLDMAFNKKLAHLRKQWLQKYNPNLVNDHKKKHLTVSNFVNYELIHYSNADNIRSLPSLVDGLKPSQRKIIYSCFKRNLKNEIKVAQLAGYVAEHSSYHHGQQSLCQAIVSLAQNYVGSNNLNLLMPLGQFGTRNQGGKDSASSRYIFTQLNPLTRLLFPQDDDHIVEYLEQQNQIIEPSYYYPILPVILINGAEGIGTAWSTSISPFKVRDVIKMVKNRINGQITIPMIGWENFKGTVQQNSKGGYTVKGKYQINDNVVTISELPIKKWTSDYKYFLEQKLQTSENKQIYELEDVKEYHTLTDINFVVTFAPEKFPDNVEKSLKLSTSVQNNNMILFNQNRQLKKYQKVENILNQFYEVRIKAYQKRKVYLISKTTRDLQIAESKLRFIKEVVEGTFNLKGKKEDWILALQNQKYRSYDQFSKIQSTKIIQNEDEGNDKDFNYLLNLPIWSFSKDKLNQLQQTIANLLSQLKSYQSKSATEMWLQDIGVFEAAWKQLHPGMEEQSPKLKPKRNTPPKKKPSPAESAKEGIQVSDSDDEVVIKRLRKNRKMLNNNINSPIKIDQGEIEVINIDSKSRSKIAPAVMDVQSQNKPTQEPKMSSVKSSQNKGVGSQSPVGQKSAIDSLFKKYMMAPANEQNVSKPHPSLLQQKKDPQN